MNCIFFIIIVILFSLLIFYNIENFDSCKIIKCNTDFILDTSLNICKANTFDEQKAKDAIKIFYDNNNKTLGYKITIYQIKQVDDKNIYVAYTRDNGIQIFSAILQAQYNLDTNMNITIVKLVYNITEATSGLKFPVIKNTKNCPFDIDKAKLAAKNYYDNTPFFKGGTINPIEIDNITDTTFNVLYTYTSGPNRIKSGKERGVFTYYYNLDCSFKITSLQYGILCFSTYLNGVEYNKCKYDEEKAISAISKFYQNNNIPYDIIIYQVYKINNNKLHILYSKIDYINGIQTTVKSSKAEVKFSIDFDGNFIVNSITYNITSDYVNYNF